VAGWPVPIHRIGRLTGNLPNPTTEAFTAVFRQALRDLGYVEGQNLILEERYANGDVLLAEPAAEQVRLQPEVIVVVSTGAARAVQTLTTTIPIVSAGQGDLVATGLAAGLARPGSNVTGLSTPALGSKQLQLLQEAVPAIARVAVLAIQYRLPAIWGQSDAVGRGGLLGYAPNRADLHRRAAGYVDQILKGARPTDLPVQEPVAFDFAINLKTAQALGLTIPQSVLQQATEVIQ
jgi:ABC-type uncharacterized transport system substrate-binding protein